MILLFLGSWRSTLIVADLASRCRSSSSIVAAQRAGPDAQHDDARRAGAGGRHPGRRRDGRDREHPPQPGDGQAARAAILDGAQQIAVPAFVSTLAICIVFVPVRLPRRRRRSTCSCRWRWRSCFAMLASLLPVAHARPDAGACTCSAGRGRRHDAATAPADPGFFGRIHQAFKRALRALPRRLRRACSTGRCTTADGLRGLRRWRSSAARPLRAVRRPRLLPDGGRRPDPPARHAPRPARGSRRPSSSSPPSRPRSASVIPADDRGDDPRQHRRCRDGINLAFTDSATISTADGEILVALNAPAQHGRPPTTSQSCARSCRASSRAHASTSSRPTSSARS